MINYYSNTRNEIFELLNKNYPGIKDANLKILEIGCGGGVFRNHFNKSEYWGVEPNTLQAQIARDNGLLVINGTFDEIQSSLPDKYFNIVVVNDVLEHMLDHDLFLNQITSKCTQKFVMVGSVPNVRFITVLLNYIFFCNWEYKDMGVLDRSHLRFFTKKTLLRSLLTNSYKLIELKGINKLTFYNSNFRDKILRIVSIFFGSDTKFMQFSFLVRYDGD